MADTPGQTPSRADTSQQMATAVDGTHPTTMHSYLQDLSKNAVNYRKFTGCMPISGKRVLSCMGGGWGGG